MKGWKTFYAGSANGSINGKKQIILMHRLILGVTDRRIHVDHENHCGTDNQRHNIRICNSSENAANAVRRAGTSNFKGVWFDAKRSLWVADIVKNGKRLFLGRHTSEIEAARAYNTAASELFGRFAFLNTFTSESSNDDGTESPASGAGNSDRKSAVA